MVRLISWPHLRFRIDNIKYYEEIWRMIYFYDIQTHCYTNVFTMFYFFKFFFFQKLWLWVMQKLLYLNSSCLFMTLNFVDDDMIQNNDKIICRQFYISNAFLFIRSTLTRLFSHQTIFFSYSPLKIHFIIILKSFCIKV